MRASKEGKGDGGGALRTGPDIGFPSGSSHGTEQTVKEDQGGVWHLDAALLAATNPEWDNAVNSLAAESCEKLGLATTAHVKPCLQHVSLFSNRRSYSFDPKAEIPPGTFATMVVLLLPPGTEIQAVIQRGSKRECVRILGCKESSLGCIAYFTGCKFSLQFRGDSGYTAMTYHLMQASDIPVVIKDQAWYLSQLEAVMEEHYSSGQSRAFYMFEHRYDIKDLDNIQSLKKNHQKMAQVLQAAEHAGILDAHLAVLTHREYCSCEADHFGGHEEAEVHDSETHVGNWRTLDGVNPGWEAETIHPYGQDEILQVKRIHSARVMNGWMSWTQTEEENEAEDWSQRFHTVSLTKYKSRAGFVIWSRRYRWDFFCQQGFKAATGKLTQMLKSLGPLAATRVPASDQPGSQMTEETQDLMSETQSLVTAMYSQFKSQLNHLGIPGFKTFEDLVLALDLQWLYINIVEATLSDVCLNMSTVHLLMSASRHVGWGKLECGLGKVITNTFCSYGLVCRDTKLVEAAEAASFLEIQDATVRPPLAVLVSILAHLARCTSHLASSGAFFNGNDVEEVSDILVDAYLQNPQYYYATEVLGPACLQVTEGQDFLGSLTESPAFVKLLAGCLYQLQRPLQLDPVRNMHKKCACADCQLVQSFLAQTEQATMLVQYSKEHAHHVMQQLQHQADFQGHMWMARQKSSSTLICSKEAPTEKLLRLQQARSLLPRVQAVFNQAVVTLFLKSGQPPAEQCAVVQQEEDEHEPKPKTKPVAVRYNLW